MKTNENQLNNIDKELDELSKKVYLESPDFWISISDKIVDKIFDEMLLFFAVKYNYYNILSFAIENNYIDLNMPSKNKDYPNIMSHFLDTAKQNEDKKIYNYLLNLNKEDTIGENASLDDLNHNTEKDTFGKKDVYIPKYMCPNCNTNIFDTGYRVSNDITYKFSFQDAEPVEVSNEITSIKCCNCDKSIENVTNDKLYSICKIQNCDNCGSSLIKVGIIAKKKMEFNENTEEFGYVSTSYCCNNCGSKINSSQKEYFKL
ncbi:MULTISPECIES: hypothetical protein [unclassified Clostridioides]|uniref:hypothetical protein n=1 Tax=unclassified Clostridioides TaxID=2635829 RepID=UPI001D13006F|nr:hypothetical protein [Clostridioides sp. ZZV14-6045]MCC0731929.1 hypothetical protein [Clostridioides sp. ZZV14-6048]MCC0735635.1 hypothetical protein [Clostridioides sp. ZZV14-6009]MCC0740590.1 hypothetical protein [Clostridioides sp. ZZV14-5902]